MRKKLFAAILTLTMVLGCMGGAMPVAMAADATTVAAPTEDLQIQFWLDSGVPYYRIVFQGTALIEDSKLGIKTEIGDFKDGFTLGSTTPSSSDTTWSPLVGEQAQIRDHYNAMSFELLHSSGLQLTLEMRAYDTGVAFRYLLPAYPAETKSYLITDEYTQFRFPAGTVAAAHINNNQTVPTKVNVESFDGSKNYMRPMTLSYPNGAAMTICEANLDNYAVMVMKKDTTTPRTLKAGYISYTSNYTDVTTGPDIVVTGAGPDATPWRTFVIGESEIDLPRNATIVQNLNEPADEATYHFADWVKPGVSLRAVTGMNTDAIKQVVDQAVEHQIEYVLLDAGWYGPEGDPNCDPRLDPSKLDLSVESDKFLLDHYFGKPGEGVYGTGEGIFNTRGFGFDHGSDTLGQEGSTQANVDIPAICSYANERGVGIILYVNGVYLPDASGRDRFTIDELFDYYVKWGVKGVKPGFVDARSQIPEYYQQMVIESAASHGLIMTIHDEYISTGTERTFPNMLATEAILGDEGIGRYGDPDGSVNPQAAEDIATLFTRTIQGPADHTFCFPGKATKGFAVASPILFKTGLQSLYWYTHPDAIPEQDRAMFGIWDGLPATWAESLYLEGKLYEYATYARKSIEDVWYVGSLSAVDRTLEVPLDFLDGGVQYVADIYWDGPDADPYAGFNATAKNEQTLRNQKYIVDSTTILKNEMHYGTGYAVKLTQATSEEIASLPAYSGSRILLEDAMFEANELNELDYTAVTWQPFAEARQAAQALLDSVEPVADAQYEQALVALSQAMQALKFSTIEISRAISTAEAYTSYCYTDESWNVLSDAITVAKQYLSLTDVTEEQIATAVGGIESALANLVMRDDLTVNKFEYLSDRNWEADSTGNNRKKDQNRTGNQLSLMVNGERVYYDKGISTDAPGNLYYDLSNDDYQYFTAMVGVDAEKDMGSVIFRVYGDGVLLYESEPSGMGTTGNAQSVIVPVAGVDELWLEADPDGSTAGDWSDWCDAKLVTYNNPRATVSAISVDGNLLPEFDIDKSIYYYPAKAGAAVPEVTAVPAVEGITCQVIPAQSVPGVTTIVATTPAGTTAQYQVYFKDFTSVYASDMKEESCSWHGGLQKDISYSGKPMSLTRADGTSEWVFDKGLGGHANLSTDSAVVYNVEGLGYDMFEAYVGIPYAAMQNEIDQGQLERDRPSVTFKLYVDDETEPRFVSSEMHMRTPAQYVLVDIRGAKKVRLVNDPGANADADWSNWADAKFISLSDAGAQLSISDVTQQGRDYNITVGFKEIDAGNATCRLSIALYDDADRLIGIQTQMLEDVSEPLQMTVQQNVGSSAVKRVRAFIWDLNLQPLAPSDLYEL